MSCRSAPKPLFDTHQAIGDVAYDVTPDGKKFVFDMPEQPFGRMPLALVVNWAAALKR
jgi:hypothetical protein